MKLADDIGEVLDKYDNGLITEEEMAKQCYIVVGMWLEKHLAAEEES